MRNYQIKGSGLPVKALLWDGKLSSAPTDRNVSVCDRTGDLYVETPQGELRVPVGEYLVDMAECLTLTMTPDAFYANASPTEETD